MAETPEERKARQAAYSRAWYARNREQHAATVKRWVESHKDVNTANQKHWRDENKERRNAHARQRYAEEPETCERIKANKRATYARHKDKMLSRAKVYRDERQKWLKDQLAERGCKLCGMRDVRCLEFHHRDPAAKSFHVQGHWSLDRQLLATEIEKCDVLCANCHRIHHRTTEGDERPQP